MDNEVKEDDWFKKWLPKQPDKKKRSISPKYILLLGGLGIALMIGSQFFQPDSNDMPVTSSEEDIEATPTFAREAEKDSMADYEIRYENQLRETLEEIIGVNDVSVSVNLAESEKNIYEKNVRSGNQTTSETDREGGTRKVEDFQDEENVVIVREVIKKKRWSYRRKNQR